MIKRLLAHPLTRGFDPDDPRTTILRRRIIREKGFLRAIYQEWYARLIDVLPHLPHTRQMRILELGSGGGFFKDILPECICSDVFYCPGNDLALDARWLPFRSGSLHAICMIDVFHHIPNVAAFLAEAQRVLRPGGVVAMWEPWNTAWSRFIYQRLHSEPFDCQASDWSFPTTGPLSGANGALPWIVFERDSERLKQDFPLLRVERIRLDFPFSYLLSGGVSLRALLPGQLFKPIRRLERSLGGRLRCCAMFAQIVLKRVPDSPDCLLSYEGR